ncbi:MAG TPA: hypothetical protein O0X27_00695 [Methanocorpusculum sp.]|nr:hypothetical protein [Methanocorpusculum sp.]
MSELRNITKKQWIITGIAIAVDVVLLLLGLYFSPIVTEMTAPNTVIPLIFNCGIVLLMFISTLVIVRIANKKR